jgi:enoyl-CoA hydratase/carnithine racemase
VLICGAAARSAPGDIREMETITGEEAQALATRQAVLMDRFSRLPQVTLAAIDGHASVADSCWPSPRICASRPTAPGSACPR